MRKALLFIASVLLAATASAQIGNPGFGAPPPDLTGYFKLGDMVTLVNGDITTTAAAADSFAFTVADLDETAGWSLNQAVFDLSVTNSGAGRTSSFRAANTGGSQNYWSVTGDSLSFGASTDGAGATAITMNSGNLGKIQFSAGDVNGNSVLSLEPDGLRTPVWAETSDKLGQSAVTYIAGGYTFNPNTNTNPAKTVAVTIVDTVPTITDGDVQVCGVEEANFTTFAVTCETLDFSGGAGTLTTSLAFRFVSNIKSSSFSVLGGDETLSATYTAGASITTGQFVTNHTAGSILNGNDTAGNSPAAIQPESFFVVKCLDLTGCSLSSLTAPYYSSGIFQVTLVVAPSSTSITVVDSAGIKVSASHSLDEFDTINLVWIPVLTAWVETGVSVN